MQFLRIGILRCLWNEASTTDVSHQKIHGHGDNVRLLENDRHFICPSDTILPPYQAEIGEHYVSVFLYSQLLVPYTNSRSRNSRLSLCRRDGLIVQA